MTVFGGRVVSYPFSSLCRQKENTNQLVPSPTVECLVEGDMRPTVVNCTGELPFWESAAVEKNAQADRRGSTPVSVNSGRLYCREGAESLLTPQLEHCDVERARDQRQARSDRRENPPGMDCNSYREAWGNGSFITAARRRVLQTTTSDSARHEQRVVERCTQTEPAAQDGVNRCRENHRVICTTSDAWTQSEGREQRENMRVPNLEEEVARLKGRVGQLESTTIHQALIIRILTQP